MVIFIRKKISNGIVYAQVVENTRYESKVIQRYIGSLGTLQELIKKLQTMQKWIKIKAKSL